MTEKSLSPSERARQTWWPKKAGWTTNLKTAIDHNHHLTQLASEIMPTGSSTALVWYSCTKCKRYNLKQDSQPADNHRKAELEKERQAHVRQERQGKESHRSFWRWVLICCLRDPFPTLSLISTRLTSSPSEKQAPKPQASPWKQIGHGDSDQYLVSRVHVVTVAWAVLGWRLVQNVCDGHCIPLLVHWYHKH